jgi:alkylation response protein AidB-like acyl-CoA dehydrogenase
LLSTALATAILPGKEGFYADAATTESGAGRIFEANAALTFARNRLHRRQAMAIPGERAKIPGEHNSLTREYRDYMKYTQIYEGTNQIQRVVIAKKLLG